MLTSIVSRSLPSEEYSPVHFLRFLISNDWYFPSPVCSNILLKSKLFHLLVESFFQLFPLLLLCSNLCLFTTEKHFYGCLAVFFGIFCYFSSLFPCVAHCSFHCEMTKVNHQCSHETEDYVTCYVIRGVMRPRIM